MHKPLLTVLGLALLLTSPAFADGAPLAVDGLDPVLLIGGEEAPGDAALTLEQDGFTYRFASKETRDRFAAEPELYGFQAKGTCAAMPSARAQGDLYVVHEAKLYGFGSPGCKEEFQLSPATFTSGREPMKVAILLFDGVELLDFAGPGEVFAAALHGRAFDVFTVAATTEPIVSQGFVRVVPEHTLADSPRPDVLVVPGGSIRGLIQDKETMKWIEATAGKAQAVLSVCNGALVLASTPLLDGLEATTHQSSLAMLEDWAPNTKVRPDLRFVDNGRILTAAGVSAGIDASLHLVGRLVNERTAAATALYLEYPWQAGNTDRPERQVAAAR
jgi:putative intracellular protease/amidase/YHS domain-containing protein